MRAIVAAAAALTIVSSSPHAWAKDSSGGGLRYTITVSEFENKAGWSGHWEIGNAWGTVLTDMLNQTGRFIVLGETDMRAAALDEQDLGASGRTAGGNKTPVTGQLTPAQLLVKGAITHVQHDASGGDGGVRVKGFKIGGKGNESKVNVTIYIVDSTTGQIVASKSVEGTSKGKGGRISYSGSNWGAGGSAYKKDNLGKAVEDASNEAVAFLTEQLESIPWTGSVVMSKGSQVYINRGTREGVTSGQTFVVGSEEVIRDPDTGEVLDRDISIIATLKADTVKEKLTICSVVSGDAGRVKKGMAVHQP